MFNHLLCNHSNEDIVLVVYEEKVRSDINRYFPVQIFHYCSKCGKFVEIGDINRFEAFSNPVFVIGIVGIVLVVICAGKYFPFMLILVTFCYIIAYLLLN